MRKNNKRLLYESIMRNVSRIIKKTLNEAGPEDWYDEDEIIDDEDDFEETCMSAKDIRNLTPAEMRRLDIYDDIYDDNF